MKKECWHKLISFVLITLSLTLCVDYCIAVRAISSELAEGHLRIIVDEPKTKVYLNDELEGLAHPDRPMIRQYLPTGDVIVKVKYLDNAEQSKLVQIIPNQFTDVIFNRTVAKDQNINNVEASELNKITYGFDTTNRSLAEILQEANKLYDLKRYTSPETDNAFLRYHYVLTKDPTNTHAINKLIEIMNFYLMLGKDADRESNYQKANEYYGKYLMVAQALEQINPNWINQTELDQRKKRKIDIETLLLSVNQLNKKADIYFIAQRFTTPKDMNAMSIYLEVLKIDPLNQHAREKIKDIISLYETWGDRAFDQQKYANAKMFFEQYQDIIKQASFIFDKNTVTKKTKKIENQLHRIQEIERFLKQGDELFERGQHIGSDSSNAFYYYQQVLQRHSMNQHARNRIQLIGKRLKTDGDQAYDMNRFDEAIEYYKQYLTVIQSVVNLSRNRQFDQDIQKVQARLESIYKNYE